MPVRKLHTILRSSVLVFTVIGATAAASNAEECVVLADEKQRLDCYDTLHGRDTALEHDQRELTEPTAQPPAESQSERQQEDDELIAAVVAMGEQLTGRSWFRLANGQVWAQISPERTTVQVGDSVRIRRTPFGTHHLRHVDGGSRGTQVRQLE